MSFRYVNRTGGPLSLPNARGGSHWFKPGESTTNQWFSRFVGDTMLTKESLDGTALTHAPRPVVDTRARTNRKIRDSELIVPPVRVEGAPPMRPDPRQAPRPGAPGRGRATPTELLSHGCQVQCEHTQQVIAAADHHVTMGGKHICRYCDFNTDDLAVMRGHTAAYHVDAPAAVEAPPPPAPDPVPEIVEVVESHAALGLVPAPSDPPPPVAAQPEPEPVAPPAEPEPIPPPVPPAPAPDPEPAAALNTCSVCGKAFASPKGLQMHRMKTKHT